jgi:hypothetical protein
MVLKILSKWELRAATLQVNSLKLRSVCWACGCAARSGVCNIDSEEAAKRSTYRYRGLFNGCDIFNFTAGSRTIVLEGRIVNGWMTLAAVKRGSRPTTGKTATLLREVAQSLSPGRTYRNRSCRC